MIARRTALGIVFACLVYAAALLATIPAPWVAQAVERASRHGLTLRDSSGTAWAGSGTLYARLRSGELLDLGRLRWRSSASSLLTGHLAVDFALGAVGDPVRVELAPSGTSVRSLSLELPAQILAQLLPALGAFGPEGRLLLRSDGLRVEAGSILGLGEIEWREVRLARVGGIDFGSHIARLRGGGDKVDIEFGTVGGRARLSGGGTWTPDHGLRISGTYDPGESPSAMTAFLQGLCSEYRGGRCSFRFPG